MSTPIFCGFCGRSFDRYKSLRQHHTDKHGDQPMPKSPKYVPPPEESEADRHIDYLIYGNRRPA